MRMDILIEQLDDGRLKASCPALPNCIAFGRDDPEARKNLKDEIVKCIKNRLRLDLPLCICDHECT